jgi:tetratricopeptide (TPR) repeat protein
MKSVWCTIVLAAVVIGNCRPAGAADLVLPFVRGLRAQGYYDTVDEYLNQVARDPRVPDEIKKRIPYERAVTLTEEAFTGKNAELQLRLLDRAASELEKFIRDNAGHPLLGDAKTRRGNIFLGKARAYTLQSQSPSNSGDREKYAKLAENSIDTARKVFQSAHDEHEKRWKTFPVHTSDPVLKKRREDAEVDYIRAQLDLAMTTYEEAQIHPRTSPKFREILTKASKQFEAMHTRYRTQIGGLLARVWQGKCFEEQNEIGRALGIYNEFLEHPAKTPAMISLQNQVLHFKLICLNHDRRKDYQLVIDFATEWLRKNRYLQRTPTGLGIRYQLTVAREKLAAKAGTPANLRQRLQRDAQRDAEYVNAFPGKYKDVTTMMIARLKRARGLQTKDPDTFSDAYSAAQVSFSGVKSAEKSLQQAKAGGKPKSERDELAAKLREQIDESTRLYRLALKLAGPKDKPEHVNTARYLLAYLYYLQADLYGRNDLLFDAAVLAEFVSRNFKNQSPDMARDCAYLAMACYSRIHSQAPRGDRGTEMQWIIRSALFITENWPGSKRAVDAVYRLGDIYDRQNRPLLAARWYSRIPPSARGRYSYALLRTGQSYWAQYLAVAAREPNRQNQLDALRQSIGGEWAVAVADLLNPSWSDWERLRKKQELEAKLTGGPVPNGQQPAAKAEPKAKAKAKKPAPPSKPIADALAKSTAELRAALPAFATLTAEQLKARSHDELRALLIAALRKQTRAELEVRFEKLLAGLSDAALKATLQRKIDLWQVLAAWYLKTGVDRLQPETPETAASPDDLIAGKTSLAQYLIGIGEYERVIVLLNDPPHSVVAAVKVADESKRPADRGITSRTFASLVYQLLARAYIGVHKPDDFEKAIASLEKIAGGDEKQNITRIYEQLGRDLQREFERLKNLGRAERLKKERDDFKWIVDKLIKKKAGLDYGFLIWIAETSYGMGEGLGDDGQAADYFRRAADAYEQILERSKDKDQRLGVRLRLANCRRSQQKYEQALQIAESVVKEKPKFLRAQVEAALALQYWADSGQTGKFQIAINGDETKGLWGWSGIATRILQSGDFPRDNNRARWTDQQKDYKQKYLQAQYYTSWCRMKQGIGQNAVTTDPKRVQVLSNAMRQLVAFSSSCGVIDDLTFIDESTRKPVNAKKAFDDLFRDVQRNMGKTQPELISLTWPVPTSEEPVESVAKGGKKKADAKQPVDEQPEAAVTHPDRQEPPSSSALPMIVGLLVLLGGLGGIGWMVFKSMGKGKRPRPAYADYAFGSSPFAAPGGRSPSAAPAKPRSSAPPAAGQKPARPKPAAGTTTAAKPRTAPPPTPKTPS